MTDKEIIHFKSLAMCETLNVFLTQKEDTPRNYKPKMVKSKLNPSVKELIFPEIKRHFFKVDENDNIYVRCGGRQIIATWILNDNNCKKKGKYHKVVNGLSISVNLDTEHLDSDSDDKEIKKVWNYIRNIVSKENFWDFYRRTFVVCPTPLF